MISFAAANTEIFFFVVAPLDDFDMKLSYLELEEV